jgi:hypothetical protein
MKDLILQPEVANNQELRRIVEAVTPILEGKIGENATVTWGLETDDSDCRRLHLRIADWENEVTAEFTPDEMKSLDRMQDRIDRLWWNLLKGAFRQRMQAVEESLAEEFEGA